MVEVPSSLPPRKKPSRLYLGSPEKLTEIDDWDLFRKKTIPELQAAGWNAVRMEGQELTHPVPPPQPQDDPVRYYFLGIVGTLPWPWARLKHHIHKFQKPLRPRSSEENADSKIWSYFHPEGNHRHCASRYNPYSELKTPYSLNSTFTVVANPYSRCICAGERQREPRPTQVRLH